MRALLILICALAAPVSVLAASANVSDLPAGRFVLDKQHASLVVKVLHLGVSYYAMRFDRLDASFTYDPAHPEAAKVTASIDTASLDANADYSGKLADLFLDAAKFPKATFVSTAIQPGADGRTGTMTGDLTLRGVTHPVTLQVRFNGVGHGMLGGTIAGFSATGVIKRSDFRSGNLLGEVGDDVSLDIEGEFARK